MAEARAMLDRATLKQARALIHELTLKGLRVATAESCTGGLIAAALTSVAGASEVVERGFVTYSNAAKTDQLGVPALALRKHGAVSPEVARAMASGGLAYSHAHLCVACTGVAGPGGGAKDKPVGLVYVAAARRDGRIEVQRCAFDGDRTAIREATVRAALYLLAAMARP